MMNDISTQTVDRKGPLTTDALYNHSDNVMIAISDHLLVPVTETGDTKHVANEATELLALPGTAVWINHIVDIRNSLARDVANEKALSQRQKTYIENLGQAILREAINRDWCEEYDEFAEQWDLPTRFSEYDVTIAVRVRARNREEAADLIRGELGFGSYHDDVIIGPEITAEEAC